MFKNFQKIGSINVPDCWFVLDAWTGSWQKLLPNLSLHPGVPKHLLKTKIILIKGSLLNDVMLIWACLILLPLCYSPMPYALCICVTKSNKISYPPSCHYPSTELQDIWMIIEVILIIYDNLVFMFIFCHKVKVFITT